MFNIPVNTTVSIPLIGDETLTLIPPPCGYRFKKTLLQEYKFKNKITDSSGQIQSEYRSALHGTTSPYIICLEHCETYVIKSDEAITIDIRAAAEKFDDLVAPICNKIEDEVFKFVSLIHLFKEGEFARKRSFYTFGIGPFCYDKTVLYEDSITFLQNPMTIEAAEVAAITDLLYNHNKAYSILKPVVVDALEYTYRVIDNATNYKSMVTPLEVMFLSNDYGQKKIMLSKRLGAFLGKNDVEMKAIYDTVMAIYEDRSTAVHEGCVSPITRSSLNELRNLVRAVTKKYISVVEQEVAANPAITFEEIKATLISTLKEIVTTKNDQNIW